jgi:predicted RNase H-like nuclease (RuvC/YqgF family)
MAHMIVGVDPGKTSAIACIGLDGKLIGTAHKSQAGAGWIIESISELGTPSIVAVDKKTPSKIAERVNAAFHSRMFIPDKDISTAEKRPAAAAAGIKNQHERDAYAAAIKAYNAYANKLKQAERISKEMKVSESSIDAIKAKVLDRYSVKEAIEGRKANRA